MVKPAPEVALETTPAGMAIGQQGAPIILSAFTNLPPPLNFIWALNQEIAQQGTDLSVFEDVLRFNPSVYTVFVEDPETGCRDSASVDVTVIPPVIRIPNTFSPNGDGHNDFFRFVAGGNVRQVLTFKIFNRWGQVVFKDFSNAPETFLGWDGTFKDKPQPSEVYFYLIRLERYDGEVEEFQGEVSLLR
jgi:gliding motility-associated-like protein